MKIKEYALTGLVIMLMFALLFSYSNIRKAEKEAQDWKTKYLNLEIKINENQNEIYKSNEKIIIKYKEVRQKNGSLGFIDIINTM